MDLLFQIAQVFLFLRQVVIGVGQVGDLLGLIVVVLAHGFLVGDFIKIIVELLFVIGFLSGIDFFIELPALLRLFGEMRAGIFQGIDVAQLILFIFANGLKMLDALELIIESGVLVDLRTGFGIRGSGMCLIS